MKIKLEVEVELFDWTKRKTMSIHSGVGNIVHDDGTKFEVTQSLITFDVNRIGYPAEGQNNHVARFGLAQLLKDMSEKLVDHAAEIEAEAEA